MNFDLNIDNYTRDELVEMFELPSNFDRNIIEIKEAKLKDNIINNKEINKETQVKTLNFLLKAKNIILNDSQKQKNTPFQKKIEDFYNSSYELKTSKLEEQEEHMVQVRPEKPYLSSYPSEFFPGIINPIKKRTIKKNLSIDTKFRDNYYTTSASNFNFNLPVNMNDVIQMQLAAIELPTTYYVVSKQYGNNFFSITVNTATTVITIPDGNYDRDTIIAAINAQLVSAGGLFASVVFTLNLIGITGSGQTLVQAGGGITVLELNFQTDKYGVTDPKDYITPLPLKLGWILGFRKGIYIGNLNYASEGIVDTTGPKYFFLVVDDYNNSVNNNYYSAFNSSILNNNVLARISLQSRVFNILEQNNLSLVTTPREYFGPVNIQTLNIQLLDEYGRVVDLNNMDYSFCVTLTTIYDL